MLITLTFLLEKWIIMCMRLPIVIIILLLTACTSNPVSEIAMVNKVPLPPPVLDSQFGKPIKVLSLSEIFSLTQQQQDDFFSYFNKRKNNLLNPNKRIYKYLEGHLKNFNFHSDTLTAKEVLSQDLGNCLSLAILTKSLSNLADVRIAYQLVETPPIYQKEGGILLSSQHVRTVLYDPEVEKEPGIFNFWKGRITVDYFPSRGTRTLRRVEENEFYSMYYRNKAAEAMVRGDLNLAFWHLKESLALKQDDAQAINMMGIIHARKGFYEHAEKLYVYGLEYGEEKLELLNNYHDLLVKRGRLEDAKEIANQLSNYEDLNPYKWISVADAAYNAKDYSTAITYYRKALKMAEYLHEPHAGIARSQYLLGNPAAAAKEIRKALKKSHKQKTTALYQTKYEMFLKQLEKE